MAVVTPRPRDAPERAALRESMRRLRYVSPREGLWTRPDNLPRASASAESWEVVEAQCSWWSGHPDDARAFAEEHFESARWSDRATTLTNRLATVTRALVEGSAGSLADGFVTGAASLAHIRADPLLPGELAADAAAGAALRRAYRTYEVAFSNALRAWFRER
jgi:phenylacetic acid degradation operon negative regulatory protein